MVIEINDQNFNDETRTGLVLTDFWASWCGPCKMQSPVVEEMSERFSDIKFTKLNTEHNQKIATELGIKAIPTLLIKKDGVVVDRLTGFHNKEMLSEILEQYR
ncbi:MAG: thioredoxin [Leuconostoc pseudomesenteroides]|uniref:thioredoxin n=1 Tax=Leuconostoc pseudomesenteroides TaxID=33968 RepID=UPI001E4097E4|nr:thioredoxin [Leuconostoc pseudomesenteroides]MCC7668964.1 thioredoxin [Leuconostoc pseudomesenteroides]